jgi:hypothetical protein
VLGTRITCPVAVDVPEIPGRPRFDEFAAALDDAQRTRAKDASGYDKRDAKRPQGEAIIGRSANRNANPSTVARPRPSASVPTRGFSNSLTARQLSVHDDDPPLPVFAEELRRFAFICVKDQSGGTPRCGSGLALQPGAGLPRPRRPVGSRPPRR